LCFSILRTFLVLHLNRKKIRFFFSKKIQWRAGSREREQPEASRATARRIVRDRCREQRAGAAASGVV
jgi:hypothetical protein